MPTEALNALTVPSHMVGGSAAPRSALQRAVDTGLLRCAVPIALGGDGGSLLDLADRVRRLRDDDPQAARMVGAQRLAIEALVHARNVALRELWLPDLLNGQRAGTVALGHAPLWGNEGARRSWLLTGQLAGLANLPWEGFSLVAPVRLGDDPPVWVLLRSEEDGLSVQTSGDQGSCGGLSTVHIDKVFFRVDEWLGGPELGGHLAPVAAALSVGTSHTSN